MIFCLLNKSSFVANFTPRPLENKRSFVVNFTPRPLENKRSFVANFTPRPLENKRSASDVSGMKRIKQERALTKVGRARSELGRISIARSAHRRVRSMGGSRVSLSSLSSSSLNNKAPLR